MRGKLWKPRLPVVYDCPWCGEGISTKVFEKGTIQECWSCGNMCELEKGKLIPQHLEEIP